MTLLRNFNMYKHIETLYHYIEQRVIDGTLKGEFARRIHSRYKEFSEHRIYMYYFYDALSVLLNRPNIRFRINPVGDKQKEVERIAKEEAVETFYEYVRKGIA